MNPYQQNIDILKKFFMRKLIIFFAFFTLLPVFSIIFININGLIDNLERRIDVSALSESGNQTNMVGTVSSLYILFIFEILLAVAFLLFFVKSSSEDSSLKVPIGIFRVVSVIELIITALTLLGMIFIVLLTSLYLLANYFSFALLVVPCMFIAIPLIFFQIFAQNIFAGNIKESANSIYLKNKGAKLYGITSIIMAALCAYIAVLLAVFGFSEILLFAPLIAFFGLSVIKYILGAAVGLKYAKYIGAFSDSSTSRESEESSSDKSNIIVCRTCGKALTAEDYFCNHCGTPVEK